MILLNRDLITELDIIAVFNVITFREFSIENLQRVRQANRGRLFLRTSGLVPFGTCICSNVETIHSWTCHVHGPFEFRISIGSSILRTNLLPNRTLLPILTLLPNFGGFHRTLQRVRLANRRRLLLRTPGPAPFGTCTSISQTFLSWVAIFHFSLAYIVFILQLIRYVRVCSSYECFILRPVRLPCKLPGQGYVRESSLRKFYVRYGDLIKYYEVSLSQKLHGILEHDHI